MIITDDINKKACSIELYLPDSIIKKEGNFFPIEWEARKKIRDIDGNEEALYQGVITQKDNINYIYNSFTTIVKRKRKFISFKMSTNSF